MRKLFLCLITLNLFGCSGSSSKHSPEVISGVRKDLKKELETQFQKEPEKLKSAIQASQSLQKVLLEPDNPSTLADQLRAARCVTIRFKNIKEIQKLNEKIFRHTFDTPEKMRAFLEWDEEQSGKPMHLKSRAEKDVCDF